MIELFLVFYCSCIVAFALYSINLLDTLNITASSAKNAKFRKTLQQIESEAKLYLKLSPLWPIILCLMIIKKTKK